MGSELLSADRVSLPGHLWHPNGQSSFSGSALNLFRRLDRLFLSWAAELGAVEYRFPSFISAAELAKIDLFRSFPHLLTFPVSLSPDPTNLKRFVNETTVGQPHLPLTSCSPVKDVLTPAACYHFYVMLQGEAIQTTRYFTTRSMCCRREASYVPLERQWTFAMREIVCIGEETAVQDFLAHCREKASAYLDRVGLASVWRLGIDPFFDPFHDPKYIAQKVSPLKNELLFEERLALASTNFHRTYFGEAFRIGAPAHSGCVGFGLERWMLAFVKTFGSRVEDWPLPPLPDAS